MTTIDLSDDFTNLHGMHQKFRNEFLENIKPGRTKVVTNAQIGVMLQDLAEYTMLKHTQSGDSPTEEYPIGTVSGIDIYVDPNMQWTDLRMIFNDGHEIKVELGENLIV